MLHETSSSPTDLSGSRARRGRPGVSAAALGVVVLAGATLIAGCSASSRPYACSTGSQCLRGGEPGTCEASGFCSFADTSCPSGRRYGELSAELTSRCVEVATDGGSGPFSDAHVASDLNASRDTGVGTDWGTRDSSDADAKPDDARKADALARDGSSARDGGGATDQGHKTDQTPLPCVCVPGTVEKGASQSCGDCAQQTPTRQCGQSCQWEAWIPGTCSSTCSGTASCDSCSKVACDGSTGCKRTCVKKAGAACTWDNGTNMRCCTTGGQRGWQFCLSSCSWSPCEVHAC